MGADIPHRAARARACGIGAPFGLFDAFVLHRRGQPVLRVFRLNDADLAQIACRHHGPRLADHRIAGVIMGEDEKRLGLGDAGRQRLRILQRGGQGLVADHMDALGQERLRGSSMDVVGRDNRDRLDPVLAGGFGLGHLLETAVGARDAQSLRTGGGFLGGRRQRACHQIKPVVNARGDAVHPADKGVIAAAHHAKSNTCHQSIPSILRFAASSVPPSAKSSKALSVTRMM